VGFLFQVFGDFAGYSLMAIGVSRFLALDLPGNFDVPLISQSLPELWRRWHITLNRWLFDYVFTPLTTSQGAFRGRVNAALLITFLASGLWHGAAWTFVLWGALHGVGMVVHQLWDAFYRGLCRKDRAYVAIRASTAYSVAAWALTMGFFLLTLIPFRARSLAEAATIVERLVGLAGGRGPALNGLEGLSALFGAAFIVTYHLSALPPLKRMRNAFKTAPPVARGLAYGIAIVFLLVFAPVGSGSFIYQQF
jgi:alginate O-acetyltransferase complex protein AlgI